MAFISMDSLRLAGLAFRRCHFSIALSVWGGDGGGASLTGSGSDSLSRPKINSAILVLDHIGGVNSSQLGQSLQRHRSQFSKAA